jgi:hypothetical protein
MDEPNPYAPPRAIRPAQAAGTSREPSADGAPPTGALLHEFTVKQLGGKPAGKRWTMRLFPDALQLMAEDEPARVLGREQFVRDTTIMVFRTPALVLQETKPRTILTLAPPEAIHALKAWFAPVREAYLGKALRAARTTPALVGLVWILPVVGAHAWRMGFGLLWLLWALLATVKPHRSLFLALAALWAGACVSFYFVGWTPSSSGGSLLWAFFVLALVAAIIRCIRSFSFYGPVDTERP